MGKKKPAPSISPPGHTVDDDGAAVASPAAAGLIILAALAPLVWFPDLYDFAHLPKRVVIRAGLAVILLAWLVSAWRRDGFSFARHPLDAPLAAFLTWALISGLWAHNSWEWRQRWGDWAFAGLAFFLARQLWSDHGIRQRALAGLLAAGAATAAIGIFQHLFSWQGIPQITPPAACFANKNMAAQHLVLTLPIGWALFARARGPVTSWAAALGTGAAALHLVYTGTRAAWLGAVASLVVYLLLRRPWRGGTTGWDLDRRLAAGVTAAAVLVMINVGPEGWHGGLESVARRAGTIRPAAALYPDAAEDGGSGAARLAIWRNTLAMIADHPFLGVGLANHKIHYPVYQQRVVPDPIFSGAHQLRHVHNDFLQTTAELGLPALAGGIWLLATLLGTVRRQLSHGSSPPAGAPAAALAAAMAGLLVTAAFSFPFQLPYGPFAFFLLAGLAATGDPALHRRRLAVGRWVVLPVAAGALLNLGVAWRDLGDLGPAEETLRRVLAIAPRYALAHNNLGNVLLAAGRDREALAAYKRASDLESEDGRFHFNLGLAALRLERFREAATAFEAALERRPGWAEAHKNLGLVYYQHLGRPADGAAHFERALSLDPSIADARVLRAIVDSVAAAPAER